MRRWLVVVITLYGLLFLSLTGPFLFVALYHPSLPFREALDIYGELLKFNETSLWYWPFFFVLLLSQVLLLIVPSEFSESPPLKPKSVLIPLVGAGLMTGLLVFGLVWTVIELIYGESWPDWDHGAAFGMALASWFLWSWIFYRISKGKEIRDVVSQQCRLLLRGSILELLIALPSHILARRRDYCFAGMGTMWGLTFGIAVMLLSFGPGILFLFKDRWKGFRRRSP